MHLRIFSFCAFSLLTSQSNIAVAHEPQNIFYPKKSILYRDIWASKIKCETSYVDVCVRVCMYMCGFVHARICVRVCMRVCMRARAYICMYMCTHIMYICRTWRCVCTLAENNPHNVCFIYMHMSWPFIIRVMRSYIYIHICIQLNPLNI